MYKFNINLSIYIIRDNEMHSVNNSIHMKYIFKILVSLSIIRSFAKKIEAILLLSFQVKSEQYFHLGKKVFLFILKLMRVFKARNEYIF